MLSPTLSLALIGTREGNSAVPAFVVPSGAPVPAPVKLVPPAGRRTRSETGLPALPDFTRQRTTTPSMGDVRPLAAVLLAG